MNIKDLLIKYSKKKKKQNDQNIFKIIMTSISYIISFYSAIKFLVLS